jgi:hypothetical protein
MLILDGPSDRTIAWNVVNLLGRHLLAICVIGGGSLALTLVAHHSARHAREPEPEFHGGGGIIERTELLHLWLPRTLIELAQGQTGPSPMHTHQGLQGILEARRQRDLWYALTFRAHQVNGEFVDVTFIRWPYSDSGRFAELIDVMAVAAGEPPVDPAFGSANPTVSVLPDHLLNCEPRDVMRDALATELK